MRQLFSSIPGQVLDFIVVLIGLVLIFKDQLTSLVNDIFDTITKKAGKV
ncbi:MAG: Flp1 family type IVb pilin [Roseburia hominis]